MAFAETDRVQIRRWLGFSAIYLQADPKLENAIVAVQSTADGGSRPDSSTETAVKGYLTELTTIETKWKALYDEVEAYKVDELVVDPARGAAVLKSFGRMYVGHIADALSTKPRRDVFCAPSLGY